MELTLNLSWLLLAALMFGLWKRKVPHSGAAPATRPNRPMQFVALAVLLLILFPVISVTDDLQTLQNAVETDCCQRRDHACAHGRSIAPIVPALPVPAVAELPSGFVSATVSGVIQPHAFASPAMASIQNRPPPVA